MHIRMHSCAHKQIPTATVNTPCCPNNKATFNLRRNFDSKVSDKAVVGLSSFFKHNAHSLASSVFVKCSPQPAEENNFAFT